MVAHLARATASKIAAVKVKVIAALLIPVSAVTTAVLLTPSGELEELTRHVLQPRREIVSGQFIVHQHTRELMQLGKETPFWMERDETVSTWFNEKGWFREDLRRKGQIEAPEAAAKFADLEREVGWIKCFADPDFFYFNHTPEYDTSADRTKWGGVERNTVASLKSRDPRGAIHEPRALMLSANGYRVTQERGEFSWGPAVAGFENVRVLETSWERKAALQVSFDWKHGVVHVEHVVVPECDYSVVKSSIEDKSVFPNNRHFPLICAATATLKQLEGGRWFPATVDVTRTESGEVVVSEHLDIETRDINRPMDPKVFSVAGFGAMGGDAGDGHGTGAVESAQ